MARHCKRFMQWGELIFLLLYMCGDLHSCLIPSPSASLLLILEKKRWRWKGRMWVRDLTFRHHPSPWAPLILCSKGNSGPLDVHGKQFPYKCASKRIFLNTEEVEDSSAAGLEFQQIPYWIICSRVLLVLWSQRKFVLPNSAVHCIHGLRNLSDTITIVGSNHTALLLLICYFYLLLLILAHREKAQLGCILEEEAQHLPWGWQQREIMSKTEVVCACWR